MRQRPGRAKGCSTRRRSCCQTHAPVQLTYPTCQTLCGSAAPGRDLVAGRVLGHAQQRRAAGCRLQRRQPLRQVPELLCSAAAHVRCLPCLLDAPHTYTSLGAALPCTRRAVTRRCATQTVNKRTYRDLHGQAATKSPECPSGFMFRLRSLFHARQQWQVLPQHTAHAAVDSNGGGRQQWRGRE